MKFPDTLWYIEFNIFCRNIQKELEIKYIVSALNRCAFTSAFAMILLIYKNYLQFFVNQDKSPSLKLWHISEFGEKELPTKAAFQQPATSKDSHYFNSFFFFFLNNDFPSFFLLSVLFFSVWLLYFDNKLHKYKIQLESHQGISIWWQHCLGY